MFKRFFMSFKFSKDLEKKINKLKGKGWISSREGIFEKYGVKNYISTGLPNLDMFLAGAGSDRGMPCGRAVELAGPPSSFKTYLSKQVLVECCRMGGYSFDISTEFDIEDKDDRLSLTAQLYETKTLLHSSSDVNINDVDGVRHFFSAAPHYDELKKIIASIIDITSDLRDEGFEGPVAVLLDSISNIISTADFELMQQGKDTSNRVGGNSQIIREFFRAHLPEFARLGILFLYVNQVRANMDIGGGFGSMGAPKYIPASNRVLDHYGSFRYILTGGKDTVVNGNSYAKKKDFKATGGELGGATVVFGVPVKIACNKRRGAPVAGEEISLKHYTTKDYQGFDFIHSLVQGLKMAGVVRTRASSDRDYFVFDEKYDGNVHQEYCKQFILDNYNRYIPTKGMNSGVFGMGEKDLLETIKASIEIDQGEFIVRLTELAFEYGPTRLSGEESGFKGVGLDLDIDENLVKEK